MFRSGRSDDIYEAPRYKYFAPDGAFLWAVSM